MKPAEVVGGDRAGNGMGDGASGKSSKRGTGQLREGPRLMAGGAATPREAGGQGRGHRRGSPRGRLLFFGESPMLVLNRTTLQSFRRLWYALENFDLFYQLLKTWPRDCKTRPKRQKKQLGRKWGSRGGEKNDTKTPLFDRPDCFHGFGAVFERSTVGPPYSLHS